MLAWVGLLGQTNGMEANYDFQDKGTYFWNTICFWQLKLNLGSAAGTLAVECFHDL